MFRPGLVSITFRQLDPQAICRLAADCGLEGIEWGGDVHVPPGEVGHAREVASLTTDHGLKVAAYGSYYRLGVSPPEEFAEVLESARALGSDLIRVWCGNEGSAEVSEDRRQRVTEDARRCAAAAQAAGFRLACEWHGNTLTDDAASAQRLFDEVNHPALQTYWQPHQRSSPGEALDDMLTALPRLAGVHVFHWTYPEGERDHRPLAEGQGVWPTYLRQAATCPAMADGQTLYALLEFVRDNDPANLAADAAELNRWLRDLQR
jgi:sugar phosphate isomerase/epimerase